MGCVTIELKNAVAGADGLLIATPEYNNSLPGVLKNTIRLAFAPAGGYSSNIQGQARRNSRRDAGWVRNCFESERVAAGSADAGTNAWFGGRLLVSRAQAVFDERGVMIDEAVKAQLQKFLVGFVEFIQS